MKLLLIEDDEELREKMRTYFQADYTVLTAANLNEAKNISAAEQPDAAVLDLVLPDGDGMTLLTEKILVCPTIILTSEIRDDLVLEGLDAGAEDYVFKPCSMAVLSKRLAIRLPNAHSELKFGFLAINPKKRTVTYRGVPVRLTSSEFNILLFLASHENQSFTVAEIYEAVWEMPALGTQTCKVHLYYLRRKLEEIAKEERYIQTDFGKGYRFSGDGR